MRLKDLQDGTTMVVGGLIIAAFVVFLFWVVG